MLAADGSCRSRSCCDHSVCKVSVLEVEWGLGCGIAAGHHRMGQERDLCREGLPCCARLSHDPPPGRSSSASRASLIQLSVQDAPKLQGRRKKIAKNGISVGGRRTHCAQSSNKRQPDPWDRQGLDSREQGEVDGG